MADAVAETGSDTRSGIGARLRAGRERLALTPLQAAEKLHVDPKVVESLEAERFDALGAPVFVKGHLKRYAELIGEQAPQLIDLYNAATKPVLPDLTKLPKAAPEARPSKLAVPSLIVLIGFVLVGVVFWIVKALPDSPAEAQRTTRTRAQPVPVEPEISSDPLTAPVGGSASTPVPAVTPPPAAAVQTPPAEAPAAAAPVQNRPMEVTLRFAADSWVEIYDAKGERLLADVGTAESQRTISGTPPFRVTFGDASAVKLDVNGKPATVPASAVSGDEAQFVINRAGRIVRARPANGG